MTDIDHMIAVMQAAKEGKAIQRRHRHLHDIDVHWIDAPKPSWNWTAFDYRVKPAGRAGAAGGGTVRLSRSSTRPPARRQVFLRCRLREVLG